MLSGLLPWSAESWAPIFSTIMCSRTIVLAPLFKPHYRGYNVFGGQMNAAV